MAEEELIKTKLEEGVFTLTFNRPDSMNAMTTALGNRVGAAMRLAARDPAVRVVVVTGAGRAFCAGGDIKNLGQADPQDPLAVQYGNDPIWNDTEMRIARLKESVLDYYLLQSMPKPTIAMVNGAAIGAGMAPALACDFRIMSENAFFLSGYANMGLSGDIGTAYFLTCVVGTAKARELMFFPDKVDAQEALRIGMVTRVVPPEKLEEETMAFARRLAAGPTLAYGHMKENLTAALELDPRTAFDIEARNFMRCFQTQDHKEAVTAFKEKRKPVFTGR
jgi:2-(1,2-epoxy-1,2-dihydrophenyl)acetyl-CoA isomerase